MNDVKKRIIEDLFEHKKENLVKFLSPFSKSWEIGILLKEYEDGRAFIYTGKRDRDYLILKGRWRKYLPSPKTIKMLEFFIERIINGQKDFSTYHWGEDLFSFAEKFYGKDWDIKNVQRKMREILNILVTMGFLYPAKNVGVGWRNSDCGTKVFYIWSVREGIFP